LHPALRKGLAENAIAIEPEPKNFRTLMANVYVNDLASRVTAHNVALGDQNGQMLQFELASNNSGDHRVHLRKDTGFFSKANVKLSRCDQKRWTHF